MFSYIIATPPKITLKIWVMEISTEVSILFLEGFNVIENETISHSIDKTEISNFMLAQKNKFSVPTVVHHTERKSNHNV